MTGRSGNPAARAWEPMTQRAVDPKFVARLRKSGGLPKGVRLEVWANRLYECIVRHQPNGITHLSIKRYDRAAHRDWRHLQSIKNEVCGLEREGVELFPRESRLVDQANETHLYVLPDETDFPVGSDEGRLVSGPEQMQEWNESEGGRGRQRSFQPGLSTGGGE